MSISELQNELNLFLDLKEIVDLRHVKSLPEITAAF